MDAYRLQLLMLPNSAKCKLVCFKTDTIVMLELIQEFVL